MTPLAHILRGTIRAYQWVLAPVLGQNCRFAPSCSHYAAEAIERHGAVGGAWLAVWRVLRCNPWGGVGEDPVPDRPPFAGLGRACVCALRGRSPRKFWAERAR